MNRAFLNCYEVGCGTFSCRNLPNRLFADLTGYIGGIRPRTPKLLEIPTFSKLFVAHLRECVYKNTFLTGLAFRLISNFIFEKVYN